MMADCPQVMVFELGVQGHYANYLQYLIEYWHREELPGFLKIVDSPAFIDYHPDVVNLVSNYGRGGIRFVPITSDENNQLMQWIGAYYGSQKLEQTLQDLSDI